MKQRLLLVIILASMVVPLASCFDVDYDVMPNKGPADQAILIWIRTDPLTDTTPSFVYVFWDKVPVISREPSLALKSGEYENRWDLSITPPQGYNYADKHMIDIWVESNNGVVKKLIYEYRITDGLPKPDWFIEFFDENPTFLEEITGPQGEQGEQGPQGIPGADSINGLNGTDGTRGDPGQVGIPGVKGIQGPVGPPGGYSPINYVLFVMVWIFSVGTMFVLKRYNIF